MKKLTNKERGGDGAVLAAWTDVCTTSPDSEPKPCMVRNRWVVAFEAGIKS